MILANLPRECRHDRSGLRMIVGAWSGIFLFCGALVPGRADDAALPPAISKARYDGLRQNCPFSVASATPAPAAPQASFAANWFVSGIGRIGEEYFVTIKSRDLSQQFSLYGTHEVVDGVELASVTWSDSVGKSSVILRKGTETAKLEFNEAELHAAPPPAAKPPTGTAPPNAAGGPRPGGTPGIPPIPLPTGVPHPVVQQPNTSGGAPQVHRRTQVILPPQ